MKSVFDCDSSGRDVWFTWLQQDRYETACEAACFLQAMQCFCRWSQVVCPRVLHRQIRFNGIYFGALGLCFQKLQVLLLLFTLYYYSSPDCYKKLFVVMSSFHNCCLYCYRGCCCSCFYFNLNRSRTRLPNSFNKVSPNYPENCTSVGVRQSLWVLLMCLQTLISNNCGLSFMCSDSVCCGVRAKPF